MPSDGLFVGFVTATLVVLTIPGPRIFYAVIRNAYYEYEVRLWSALGLSASSFMHVIAAAAGISATCFSAASAETEFLTEARAKAEITEAVNFLRDQHPDPFWHTSQRQFQFELNKILEFEGEVSLAKHYFNISKLYAMVMDTHTQLYPSAERPIINKTYPIRVRLFSEGLFIIGAGDPYREWVGKKIVSISDKPINDVLNKLAEYAFSDNYYRKVVFAEIYFYWPEMYEVLGLTDDDGGVSLVLEDIKGKRDSVRLMEANSESFVDHFSKLYTATGTDPIPSGWTELDDVFDFDKPLYEQNRDKNYSYKYLPGSKTMYVQINRPSNHDEGKTALEFNLEWFDVLRNSEVERFILDVRHNPGGWINLTAPIPALLSAYRIDDEEKILNTYIVLIGRDSVSAASTAVASMEAELSRTITIGQPTGSRPALFLNYEKLTLPYSRIELAVSTTSMPALENDDRMFIAPDIWIDDSFNEYIAGKDSAMEAALSVTRDMIDNFHEGRPPMRAWNRKSQDIALTGPKKIITNFPR